LEAGRRDGERIIPDVDIFEGVASVSIGYRNAPGGGPCVEESDLRTLQESPARVADGAEDGAEGGLRQQRARREGREAESKQKKRSNSAAIGYREMNPVHSVTFQEIFTGVPVFLRLQIDDYSNVAPGTARGGSKFKKK
jgi:hypothetical protein